MTKEEAINKVKGYLTDCLPKDNDNEVEDIIKALEQQSSCKSCGADNRGTERRYRRMIDAYKKDYELKQCPFCGGKAEYTKVGNSYIGIKQATIKCTKCYVKMTQKFIHKRFDFEWIDSTMVDSWNRRAESEVEECGENNS